jgi:hypothetical protein
LCFVKRVGRPGGESHPIAFNEPITQLSNCRSWPFSTVVAGRRFGRYQGKS